MSFCAGFINHNFKNAKYPSLFLRRKRQQFLGDKAALLTGGDVEHICKKQVCVTLQRIGDRNKGI